MSLTTLRTLAGKEFHHLLPLVFALLALELLGLMEWFVVQSPDAVTWAEVSVLLNRSLAESAGVTYLIVGVITAYVLFPHESQQNTLQFLWSLPVARWQIYATKLATAFAVLAALLIAGHVLLLWVHSFAANSISATQFSWRLWAWELASLIGVVAIALGYGALVACFRIVGVLVFLTIWGAALVLVFIDPAYEYLDAGTLLVPEYRGTDVLLNEKTWILHSVSASICVVVAGLVWTRDGQPPADRKQSARTGSRIVTGLMVLLTLILILGYGATTLAPGLAGGDTSGPDGGELESVDTRYYEISYHEADRAHAQLLQKDADLRGQQVRALLGVTSNERTLADLTDTSADHLGIAGWKKLRIRRSALYDPEQRSHVFVHETAHVLAAAASNRRLADHFAYTLFFNEGLAEWVSYEILGLDDQRHALRLLATLAWQRFDMQFGDLMSAAGFRARFDENLIYALGEAWVSTLAATCGREAPGAVLQAMARPDAPQQLRGAAFWRDTLQAIDCDLNAVNGRLELLLRDYRNQTGNVPALTGAIEILDDRLVVSFALEPAEQPQTYRVSVRVRDNPYASPAAVLSRSTQLQTGATTTLELPRRMVSGDRFQYQLGIEFLPGERPFFGRWIDEG